MRNMVSLARFYLLLLIAPQNSLQQGPKYFFMGTA
jgi:hypothetical protein